MNDISDIMGWHMQRDVEKSNLSRKEKDSLKLRISINYN